MEQCLPMIYGFVVRTVSNMATEPAPDGEKDTLAPSAPRRAHSASSRSPSLVALLCIVLLVGIIIGSKHPVAPEQGVVVAAPPASTTPSPGSEPTSVPLVHTPTLTTPHVLTPTATPLPSPSQAEFDALQKDVEALRHDVDTLWSAYYLTRAACQLADAEDSLRVNDLAETDQVLMTVGVSLERAYERSSEQDKGPISEFRLQVADIREDLYNHPENLDMQLRRLRQSMFSLVDEGE